MPVAVDYKQYEGQRVILTRNLDEPNEKGETSVEIECRVEIANEQALMVKPKGKTNLDIVSLDEIEEIRLAPDKGKSLTARKLQHPALGQVRAHLLERHGLTLKEANALTEEDAQAQHDGIDHVKADLGHVHVEKKDADKPEAAS